MADPTFQANNPQMGDDFAAVYEATAHRITGPISNTALDLVGIGPGNRILDIAAGAGALSGPAAEMSAAGLGSIEVHRVEGIWRGGVGDAYFADTEALHGYMPPYAALNQAARERLRAAIRTFVAEQCVGETVEFRTPVVLQLGTASDIRDS